MPDTALAAPKFRGGESFEPSPTGQGIRVALFHSKLQDRLLQPLLAADKPPARPEIGNALAALQRAVNDYANAARLQPATT